MNWWVGIKTTPNPSASSVSFLFPSCPFSVHPPPTNVHTRTHTYDPDPLLPLSPTSATPPHPQADDPSPLTWTSWERDAHLVLYAPGEKRRWTLRDALASAKANGHLFYRKVGPLRGEEVAALCRELYGDGHQEEEGASSSSSSSMMLSPSSYSIEAALLARAAKRARHGGGGSSSTSGFLSPDGAAGSETTKPAGRRYTLRVPTRHCVADGSGGLYCALLPTTAAAANIIKSAAAAAAGGEDGDMAIRRGRLETLAKGRR